MSNEWKSLNSSYIIFLKGENMDDKTLIIYAYITASSYRVRTMKAINTQVLNPTNIAKKSDIKTNHISKVLKELCDKKLAICINEEAKKNRMYKLTNSGLEILGEL